MKYIPIVLIALFAWFTPAQAQVTYPPNSIPVTASGTGTTGAVTATIAALASKTAYICGFYYAGTNATAAQTGSVTVTGVVGGPMQFGFPTLALGATVPNTLPTDEQFIPCVPATSAGVAIVVAGPALGGGATLATTTAWGYYQ
jgi:hypothetical protein